MQYFFPLLIRIWHFLCITCVPLKIIFPYNHVNVSQRQGTCRRGQSPLKISIFTFKGVVKKSELDMKWAFLQLLNNLYFNQCFEYILFMVFLTVKFRSYCTSSSCVLFIEDWRPSLISERECSGISCARSWLQTGKEEQETKREY